MSTEGFKFKAPSTEPNELIGKNILESDNVSGDSEEDLALFRTSAEQIAGVDFSIFLGEGFDSEFFADKLGVLPPKNQAFEAWNSFLRENQGEKFQDRQIEISLLSKIVSKLLGESDAPLLFPVFIKAVQDYSKNRDLPTDHITPELMEQFYNQVSVSLADSRI